VVGPFFTNKIEILMTKQIMSRPRWLVTVNNPESCFEWEQEAQEYPNLSIFGFVYFHVCAIHSFLEKGQKLQTRKFSSLNLGY
jgi:hypothetical protein